MKIFARYFLGTLLIILLFGCKSQQTTIPQQITIVPTATVLPTALVTPTSHPLVISVQNASSLKLEKIIGAGKVNDVAWSPVGGIIAVAQDFDILFYDSASLQLIGNVGFGGTEVVFAPDGLFMAIAKDTNILLIWDIGEETVTQEFEIEMARINHVIYNAAGNYLAVLGDSSITGGDPEYVLEVWDVDAGEKVIFNHGYDSDANIAFSPDGEILAFVNVSGLTFFQIKTGGQQKVDLTWENGSLSYISDDILLKRFDYNQLKVIDLKTFETLNLISVNNAMYSEFKVSPDKKKIVFPAVWDSEKYLWITQVWDLETENLLYTLDFYSDVTRIDFSPDGKYFISADYDGYIRIHDLQTGETVKQLEFTTQVEDVDFITMGDGEVSILAGYYQGRVSLWHLADNQVMRNFDGLPYGGNTVSVSLDQKFLVTKRDYSTGDIWEVQTGFLTKTINCPDKQVMYNMLFSNDGNSVLMECGNSTVNSIIAWDLESQKQIFVSSGIMLARIPIDNRLVVLSNFDSRSPFFVADVPEFKVMDILEQETLFDVTLDKELYYLTISDSALSSDGEIFVLVANNLAALVWSTDSNERKHSLTGHETMCFEGGCAGVQDITFGPYGYLLASAGYDKTVRLWDAYSGKQLAVLDDITDAVNSVAFSPDGRYLIAGCDDGRIYVWSIEL